jgi:hypothetical protein
MRPRGQSWIQMLVNLLPAKHGNQGSQTPRDEFRGAVNPSSALQTIAFITISRDSEPLC